MIFRTCEHCGANLDPGEKCDCQKTVELKPKEESQTKTDKNLNV